MKAVSFTVPGICGQGLHFQINGFSLVYLCIAVLMWVVSGIFSLEYMAHYERRKRYYWFFWVTLAAIAGVFLSADFYTTFIFFEIMSFTSYVWVAFDEKKESLRAAETYLAVAVIGGMVMLMGLFLLQNLCGTLDFERLGEAAGEILKGDFAGTGRPIALGSPRVQLYVSAGMLLFGFGAKAGCFPLHIWLPKAHPVAPAPASALLSGILTKAGVFGIIVVSCVLLGADAGWGMLIASLGLVTMFLGALLALFSVNLKKTLACSSVSQIGFILTGIGMSCLLKAVGEDNGLAVRGTFLHMVNHSLFKLILFLCAAAVFMNLHQLDFNEVRGFGRKKPALLFCYLMGALGIGGVPLWSGYASKTLLHESIVEYAHAVEKLEAAGNLGPWAGDPAFWHRAEWVFLITGGMTVAYMAKVFVVLFVERHPSRQKEFDAMSAGYLRPVSSIALVAVSLIVPVLGLVPSAAMDRLASLAGPFFRWGGHMHPVAYFSLENLKGGAVSLTVGVFLYILVVRAWLMGKGDPRYLDRWPGWMDLENLIYRPLVRAFLAVSLLGCRAMDSLADALILAARKTTHSQVFLAGAMGGKRAAKRKEGSRGYRFARVLALALGRLRRSGSLVEESFSYGLMLFCIGLCLTLGYLLVAFFRG